MRLFSTIAFFLGLLAATAARGAATLDYSGADIAAGPGVLTIRCNDGARAMWELDLARPKDTPDVRITRFRDLTDKSDFSYANSAKKEYSLLVVHDRSHLAANSFVEVHKADDYYEFKLKENHGEAVAVVNYRINAAEATGTRLVVRRTIINTSGRTLTGALSGAPMFATLTLNVGDYDARKGGAKCTLEPYDAAGRRRHKLPDGQDAIWETTDNLARSNPQFDAKEFLWGQATVMDSAVTRQLGLTPGRSFRLSANIVAYYPALTIGSVTLDGRTVALDGLQLNFMPREWLGKSRDEHNVIGIPTDGVASKTFTLTINIASK